MKCPRCNTRERTRYTYCMECKADKQREYVARKRGEVNQRQREDYLRNREERKAKVTERHHSCEILRRSITGAWKANSRSDEKVTQAEMRLIIENSGHSCYHCGELTDKFHFDHVKPLSAGGANRPWNIVVSCPTCNLSKGDKYDA